MTYPIPHIGRTALTVCAAAAAVLGQLGTASALSLDIEDITAVRMERKRANADGKLPLPGTPDLRRLDERLAEKGVAKDAPILIRVFKAESEMEVWTGDEDGNYSLFATYPICYWSGTLGPKRREGDRQAPEGFYTVTMEQSIHKGTRWPKALNIGYPNAYDKVNMRSGGYILIHGGCGSIGCFAMTNAVSYEVYKLAVDALEAGQPNIPVHVFPFRMTDANLAKYDAPDWRSFWTNLKEGYDLFERTRRPPRVSVCGPRYGFTPASRVEGYNPGPIEVCPETEQVIADLSRINKRVAEQPEPQTQNVGDQDCVYQRAGLLPRRSSADGRRRQPHGRELRAAGRAAHSASRCQRHADRPPAVLARIAELPALRGAARAGGAEGVAQAQRAQAPQGALIEAEEVEAQAGAPPPALPLK